VLDPRRQHQNLSCADVGKLLLDPQRPRPLQNDVELPRYANSLPLTRRPVFCHQPAWRRAAEPQGATRWSACSSSTRSVRDCGR